ncbi:unnamed protein product [Schistosoma rodhaini]|uniref:Elongation of very long chain fatty acids protein n=1 Tax=Schistosoma mansoni TaxID=6183 RepID=A0A3Q0KC98_SCHMA|nr:unnamed protein product [Schistosoma rodhaini]
MYHNLSYWFTEQFLPSKPDPRLSTYPLMSTWTPTALISLAYTIIVYLWRMELIRRMNKQKMEINLNDKSLIKSSDQKQSITYYMVIYNFSMVLFSTYLSISSFILIRQLDYGLGCIELPDPNDKRTDNLVYYGYLFFFSKFVEMLDTVFFLYRGKVDQVTFLHVFHHASMPPSVWWGLKYAPGGLLYMFPLINSFVHIIMYIYYGLTSIGLYQYLWWKNYLTIIQMLQFLWFIIHQGKFLLFYKQCKFPKIFPFIICLYSLLFFLLFLNFYIKAYWKKERLIKKIKKK